MSGTLQQCLDKLFENGAMLDEIPNMKRITDKVIAAVEQSKPRKPVSSQASARIASARRTWSLLREQVKDATCEWAQGIEDAFHRLTTKSAAPGTFPSWLTSATCMVLSMLLARGFLR